MNVSSALRALLPVAGGLLALAHFGVDHSGRAIAVATAMALAWLFESLHPAIVGFIGAFLFRATEAAEFETAFGGFATALPWQLFGVLLLVTAAEQGGLSAAIGRVLPPVIKSSVAGAAVTVIGVALILSWFMPQPLARAAVLMILAVSIAPPDSSRRALLGAVAAMASVVFETHLAGAASLILNAGSALALVAGALIAGRALDPVDRPPAAPGKLDGAVVAIVMLAVLLWATASQHRLQPELVGLGGGLVCAIVALARGWKSVTADPLAMILAGTALSIPAVLRETEALQPLVASAHHLMSSLALPSSLADYWAWTGLRVFMVDAAVATQAAWTLPASAAATTMFAVHQAPSLALAMAICGSRTRQVLMLGAAVVIVRSMMMLVL